MNNLRKRWPGIDPIQGLKAVRYGRYDIVPYYTFKYKLIEVRGEYGMDVAICNELSKAQVGPVYLWEW